VKNGATEISENENKQNYEEKAKNLLTKLGRPKGPRKFKRPFFIELTGSPSAGKTTIIQILDPFFRRMGYNVYIPQEGAEVVREIKRNTHLYNVATGIYALNKLIHASVNPNYDLVIFDRCIYDAWTWMNYWHQKNEFPAYKRDDLQNFFLFETWQKMIDAVFFVVTTPEEAVKRDLEVSLTEKFGETTNPESIKKLVNLFHETYLAFKNRKGVYLLDTTDMDRKKMSEFILKKALNAMEKRFLG
jgi:thymidylate kinase